MKNGFSLVEVLVIFSFIALLAAFIIPALNEQYNGISSQTPNETHRIVVIDGCQYIEVDREISRSSTHIYSLTHKGNCTNSIHFIEKVEKE